MPAPTTYEVRATAGLGKPATLTAAGATLPIDVAWGGVPSGHPGPGELLAAAFAACLLKNLARCRELIGFDYDEAEVSVIARRQDTPPRFVEIAYTVRVTTAEPQRRVDLVHQNLRRFGTVVNTLGSACDVHGTVEAVPPVPSSPSGTSAQAEVVEEP
ncbi:OsmC family protein [Pimelobacter simplex]|uniref:OsmC family protein n=1 Tax=Nocardioides simplex TaxID=2045 RepID=UPI001932D4E4|nr:OsmC family protein [Pimelobacter simplex]